MEGVVAVMTRGWGWKGKQLPEGWAVAGRGSNPARLRRFDTAEGNSLELTKADAPL
jgi:hypothetical protein